MPKPRFLLLLVPLLAVVACAPIGSPSTSCQDGPAIERAVFDAANTDRVANGLSPVAWDNQLAGWAEEHAQKMATAGWLHHIDWNQIDEGDWSGTLAGGLSHYGPPKDNVAGPAIPPRDGEGLEQAWYGSAAHRANILNSDHAYSGVGIVCAGGAQWAVQIFGWRP
jgi:uncharacterized protein YkwD